MNESNNHLKNPFAVPFNPLRLGVLLVFREVEGDEAVQGCSCQLC